MRVGDVLVTGLSDGLFVARPSYFGGDVPRDARPDFFDRNGEAWLPIGSLIRTVDRVVLVDAGLGPDVQELTDGMRLVGGQLLNELRACGTSLTAITDVICTHLHADHIGWLFTAAGEPVFPNATVWFGAADWSHFVAGICECAAHLRRGFTKYEGSARLRLLTEPEGIAPGIRSRPAPGHTPGSLIVEVFSRGERLLLLGDAITCPIQLDEPSWHSFGDVDIAAAEQTRHDLWAELSRPDTRGVGSHFPDLQPGRVLDDGRRTWQA